MGSLSSMIDIIFLLIIFFIVTASFDNAQLDQEVLLPEISGQTPVKSLPPDKLIINIRQNGEVRIGFIAIPPQQVKSGALREILKKNLRGISSKIIINGDARTKHKHIVNIMDAVASFGYDNVQINAAVSNGNSKI